MVIMDTTASAVFFFLFGVAFSLPASRSFGVGVPKGFPGSDPFIVGGDAVEGRKYPGQVSIQFFGLNSCGGSIINENYLLTAAHCCGHQPDELNVYSGSNNIYEGGDQHLVLEIKVHEKYNESDSWHNDIAVMKVDPPFKFDEGTAPVVLPDPGQITPTDAVATVVGWGRLSEGGRPPFDLREVNISIIDHDLCNKIYEQNGLRVSDEQICAGTKQGNMGPCHGDSGGPLFVNGKVAGIVSWSIGCAEKGYPAVYTEVSDYIEWIKSKVES